MSDFSFRLEVLVAENCALLSYYAESIGNFCRRLTKPIGPISRVLNS